ncbi:MAG TPA: phage tail sheath subtilisin-like domain-containing protein [Symbiobacteriaceae bacterium]|nr:phage tail sheath subtilisin-like domain-containing protein [Symbiobacteriaceae bacterium]
MPTYLAPGVYVEEVDKGPKPIEAVATAVAGFVGIAARGPMNRPVSVNSWSDYVRVFGGFAKDSMMSYAAFGYFNNGGQNAYVVRVANPATMSRARRILSYRPANRRSQYTTLAAVAQGSNLVRLTSVAGIAPGDKLKLKKGTPTEEHLVVSVDSATGVVTLDGALTLDYTKAGALTITVSLQAVASLTATQTALTGTELEVADVTGVATGDELTLKIPVENQDPTTVKRTVTAVDVAAKSITLSEAVNGTIDVAVTLTAATPAASYTAATTVAAGAGSLTLNTVTGLPVGARLEIRENDAAETVTVESVSTEGTKTITFSPKLSRGYAAPAISVVSGVSFPEEYALAAEAKVGDPTVQLADVRGLAVGDRIALWETAESPELFRIEQINANQTVKLSSTLSKAYTAAAMVVPHPGLQLMAAPDPAAVAVTAAAQSNGNGSWGNDVQVRVDESVLVRTNLTDRVAADAKEAKLKTAKGIAAGSLLRFADRKTGVEEYRVVTRVYADANRVEWADGLTNAFEVADTDVSTVGFRLTVRHRWSGATEVFDGLSLEQANTDRYAVTLLNQAQGESKASSLVEATSLIDAAWTEVARENKLLLPMKKGAWVNLQGGRNGSVDITVDQIKGQNLGPDNRSGLAAFEGIDQVTMVICADAVGTNDKGESLFNAAGTQAMHGALLEHAELMADRFAIVDSRKGLDLQGIQDQRENLVSKYGALYYPWVAVDNPLDEKGGQLLVPPSGHIAGLYARIDQQRGVHKAPANEVLFGVRGLEVQVSMAEQNLLNPLGINCIRSFPGRGIRVWGARTLAGEASWRYINVRRLFLQIEESISQGTQWTVFEPNDPGLWAKIRRDVSAFLYRFYLQGAFFGGSPEEAYYVKCDAETNPPEVVDAGQVVIEVGIAPVKPAEFVVFRIGQKPTGGAVSE